MDKKFGFVDRNISKLYNRDNNLACIINYMAKINKAALAEAISSKAGVSKKEAEEMIAAFVKIVTSTLQEGNEVTIAGFGAFSAKTRAGRIGVNPQNPSQKIQIPPVTVPKFKAGKGLKDALKGKKDSPAPTPSTEPETKPTEETPTEESSEQTV